MSAPLPDTEAVGVGHAAMVVVTNALMRVVDPIGLLTDDQWAVVTATERSIADDPDHPMHDEGVWLLGILERIREGAVREARR